MGWIFDEELGVKRVGEVSREPRPEAPRQFRGVDCALLAERYVAYRREKGLDAVTPPVIPEIVIKSAPPAAETPAEQA